jgi:hypothetical protein
MGKVDVAGEFFVVQWQIEKWVGELELHSSFSLGDSHPGTSYS